jgi:hypothetical protein
VRYFIALTLLIAAVIHLLPLVGVSGPERLSALYGISVTEQNLEILMRHRAVLLGLLGAFLAFAAFNPPIQTIGFVVGLISVVSFLLLALNVGQYNAQLSRVVLADVLALIPLLAGAIALAVSRRAG